MSNIINGLVQHDGAIMRHHVHLCTLENVAVNYVSLIAKRSTKAVPICAQICNPLYSLSYLGVVGCLL